MSIYTCPCCKSSSVILERDLSLLTCQRCSHEWLAYPQPIDYSQQKIRNHNNHFLQKKCLERTSFILDYLPENISVLEIGCAEGFLLRSLMENDRVKVAIGVEPSLDKELFDGTNIRIFSDFDSLSDCTDKIKFNLLCSFHVLEHILNPSDFLYSLRQYADDNASLIIEVPCRSGNRLLDYDPNPEHIHRFSPSSLTILRKSASRVSSLSRSF